MRLRLLFFCLTVSCFACGDDSTTDPTGDAGSNDSDGGINGDSAIYVVAARQLNIATGDRTVLVQAIPNLDAQALDPTAAIEFSGFSRVQTFDGAVFTFDGENGEVSRFEVADDLSFIEAGAFSMMGVGVVSFISTFAWISPTRAYYVDLNMAQVVVFDPTAMELTNTFPIPDLARPEASVPSGGRPLILGDDVILPIGWSDQSAGTARAVVAVLILSASRDEVRGIVEDDRCALSGGGFVDGGFAHILGDSGGGIWDIATGGSFPAPCLLRIAEGQTAFDPDFALDMRGAVPGPQVTRAVGPGDGTFVTRYLDPDLDTTPFVSNPLSYFFIESWRYAVVDLSEGTGTAIEALPFASIGFTPPVVDGAYFLLQGAGDRSQTTVFRLEGTTPVESISTSGEIQFLDRVR
ncbi:MAG: hypothetical protein AAGF12_23015 [Myxococcota bacterium]